MITGIKKDYGEMVKTPNVFGTCVSPWFVSSRTTVFTKRIVLVKTLTLAACIMFYSLLNTFRHCWYFHQQYAMVSSRR